MSDLQDYDDALYRWGIAALHDGTPPCGYCLEASMTVRCGGTVLLFAWPCHRPSGLRIKSAMTGRRRLVLSCSPVSPCHPSGLRIKSAMTGRRRLVLSCSPRHPAPCGYCLEASMTVTTLWFPAYAGMTVRAAAPLDCGSSPQ